MSEDFSSAVQDELSTLLTRLAEPVEAGDNVKSCIRRAAERSGLTFNQARHGWYREWKNIPAHVADQVRQRAAEHDRNLKHAALQTLLAMQKSDPEFYREAIEALGVVLRDQRETRRTGGARG